MEEISKRMIFMLPLRSADALYPNQTVMRKGFVERSRAVTHKFEVNPVEQ